MTSTTLDAGGGAARTASRTAIGGRTSSGRRSRSCPTARSARWAACSPRSRDLGAYGRAHARRVAAARRRRAGAGAALVAARDAAGVRATTAHRRSRDARRRADAAAPAATATGSASGKLPLRAHRRRTRGGLPGFGSLMRWLPEYGVGIVAFGNRTYTGWGGIARPGARDARADGRARAARARSRRRCSSRGGRQVSRLVAAVGRRARRQRRGDEPVPRRLARPPARPRSRALRRARRAVPRRGRVRVVENALRGRWMHALRRAATCASRSPSRRRCRRRVQYLEVTSEPATPRPRRGVCGP